VDVGSQLNLKKLVLVFASIVVGIGLLSWLWDFYHSGKIIITTDNPNNTIVLTKVAKDGKADETKIFKAHEKLSVTVDVGSYSASVNGNSVATVQTLDLKPRQTLTYKINPINATGVEPVAYKNAQNIAVSAKELIYLDPSSSKLNTIDKQNNVTEVNTPYHFQDVKWANPSFGIGQNVGHLYIIENNNISELEMPFPYDGKPVSYDVLPDKKIYVSSGSDVFVGNKEGNFKKIYTATSPNPALAASNNGVAVSDSKYGGNASDIDKPLLAVINNSGKVTKKNAESERLAWSPDGKYLVAANEVNPIIYDTSLRSITTIPTKSAVGQFRWLNDTSVIYAMEDQFWVYDLQNKKSQLFANMPLNDSITGLYLNADRDYVYLTTLNSYSQTPAIKRVGLKGQSVPEYMYRLQDILPRNYEQYSLSLVGFSRPSNIVVQPYGHTSTPDYVGEARERLRALGFNPNQFQFRLAQRTSGE
jgi:hypothetical protein